MKYLVLLVFFCLPLTGGIDNTVPTITDISYSDITMFTVRINWKTNIPADSKVRWMLSDSINQQILYADSTFDAAMDTIHSVMLNYLNPHSIYNFNITSSSASGTTTSTDKLFATQSTNDGTIKVFFNRAVDTTVSTGIKAEGNVNLEETLLSRIASSNFYIDAAVSVFEDARAITGALIKAKDKGVVIRFIYDGKQNSMWIDSLIANGIPVLKRNYDTGNGHGMHMNFWVFEARCLCSGGLVYVWNSTADISSASLYSDKNSAVDINDRTLAYVYTREFEQMWGSHNNTPNPVYSKFGDRKTETTPHLLNINGVYTEVYFSPSDSVEKRIKNFFNTANNGIAFGSNDFKSQSLYYSLYSLRNSKNIRGIFDLANAPYGVYQSMKSWADVRIDSTAGNFSNKYVITDPVTGNQNAAVLTGTYNWTSNSNLYNDEDIIIFHSPQVANLYYQEFHRRYRDITGHPVSVTNISGVVPSGYSLEQNYPNPFNSQTCIGFKLAGNSNVKLFIYNSLGQKAAELVNGKYNAGAYKVNFDAGKLSSGTYFCILYTNDFTDVKNLVLIK
ncbi:MAG: phospholipase D-like domain-containing protein [Ignavibacteria bacterium]|nr:phospholipase D-like domain-containing protein [Ignavibacteria bacterium]